MSFSLRSVHPDSTAMPAAAQPSVDCADSASRVHKPQLLARALPAVMHPFAQPGAVSQGTRAAVCFPNGPICKLDLFGSILPDEPHPIGECFFLRNVPQPVCSDAAPGVDCSACARCVSMSQCPKFSLYILGLMGMM